MPFTKYLKLLLLKIINLLPASTLSGSDTLMTTASTQTVTGDKTFPSIKLLDTGSDHVITLDTASNEAADRTLTIPALGGNDTLVTLATTQTLTGPKTFSGDAAFTGGANALTVNVPTTPDTTTAVILVPSIVTQAGQVIQMLDGQAVSPWEVQNHLGVVKVNADYNGRLNAVGFTISATEVVTQSGTAIRVAAGSYFQSVELWGNGAAVVTISAASGLGVTKTITAPGTNGDQTINKIAGRVNFAAAGSTALVVTNSLVTANSIVVATMATSGNATALYVTSVVPASGSFTININATPTATAVAVDFVVIN